MRRQELIASIGKIQRNEGTEEEIDADIDMLCASVADPQAANHIFQDDLSAEEITDKILAYRPIHP